MEWSGATGATALLAGTSGTRVLYFRCPDWAGGQRAFRHASAMLGCNEGGYSEGTPRALRGYSEGTTRVPLEYSEGTLRVQYSPAGCLLELPPRRRRRAVRSLLACARARHGGGAGRRLLGRADGNAAGKPQVGLLLTVERKWEYFLLQSASGITAYCRVQVGLLLTVERKWDCCLL